MLGLGLGPPPLKTLLSIPSAIITYDGLEKSRQKDIPSRARLYGSCRSVRKTRDDQVWRDNGYLGRYLRRDKRWMKESIRLKRLRLSKHLQMMGFRGTLVAKLPYF